jgi:hypothetical protein
MLGEGVGDSLAACDIACRDMPRTRSSSRGCLPLLFAAGDNKDAALSASLLHRLPLALYTGVLRVDDTDFTASGISTPQYCANYEFCVAYSGIASEFTKFMI